MYCRNCGNHMVDIAAVCVKCGTPKGAGVNFCPNCAQPTTPQSAICIHCGIALPQVYAPGAQKSKMAAGLLALFLGTLGVHNFYLGYTGKAIAQLLISVLSCGMLAAVSMVWGIVEGVMILTGSMNVDANGIPLSD